MKLDFQKLKTNWFENEDQFQAYCIMMISQEFPLLRGKVWHTQNEQHIPPLEGESTRKGQPGYERYIARCAKIGNQNKAKGKLAGVPDILIRLYGVLFEIELKQPDGVLTKSQEELHPIWNADCPQIPILVCFTPWEVYQYCKWICATKLRIDFPANFKVPEIEKPLLLKSA